MCDRDILRGFPRVFFYNVGYKQVNELRKSTEERLPTIKYERKT